MSWISGSKPFSYALQSECGLPFFPLQPENPLARQWQRLSSHNWNIPFSFFWFVPKSNLKFRRKWWMHILRCNGLYIMYAKIMHFSIVLLIYFYAFVFMLEDLCIRNRLVLIVIVLLSSLSTSKEANNYRIIRLSRSIAEKWEEKAVDDRTNKTIEEGFRPHQNRATEEKNKAKIKLHIEEICDLIFFFVICLFACLFVEWDRHYLRMPLF